MEYRKDKGVANVQNPVNQNNQAVNNQQWNQRRWNDLLCSNSGIMTLILILFLIFVSRYIQNLWILNNFYLNKAERVQIISMFDTFVFCVVVVIIYARNDRLYKHVKTEISDLLYG